MNNVASLELSKELYELSLWIEDGAGWHRVGDEYPYPKYSLGYLLRKLPKPSLVLAREECYEAQYRKKPVYTQGFTPEDALCKLAINLYKQGVLKREASNE